MRLGLIRAAYVRDSHAKEDAHTGHSRIADWLKFLAKQDRLIAQALDDFAFSDKLVRVAVSHNQDIHWLERQLRQQLKIENPHAEQVATGLGIVHWTWIGWLLRLADVFDCDKSRTPKILFDHGGITDSRSQTEWQKHLAIPEPPLWPDESTDPLLYICCKSPSPIVEKAIHQIIGWMNEEIKNVRAAQDKAHSNHPIPPVDLPQKAEVDIKQREGGYIYHDMEFRLDRDAVVELLMGESLYGGPELALRELVQNALDAVHLRDQRNKLAEELNRTASTEKPRQPHEPWQGVKPGVEVTWGEEDGRKFIRVTDNGVGITVATMRKFLTQIGKSYYKSDDFRAEQAMMRRHGILCTAISQFGIGFLSVFMLADHVTIHTRPVGAEDKEQADRTKPFPFRAEIHGPHALLAFYPDEGILRSGTTVTLWLKDQFAFQDWNKEHLISQLKEEFYGIAVSKDLRDHLQNVKASMKPLDLIDPGFEVARHVVWPLHPVRIGPKDDSIEIDDKFHHRHLVPLDVCSLKSEATKWGYCIPEIDHLSWQVCEWIDQLEGDNGAAETGTRVRLTFPHPNGHLHSSLVPHEILKIPDKLDSGVPRSVMLGVTENCLPISKYRYQLLVNGMRVVPGLVLSGREHRIRLFSDYFHVCVGAGAFLWIDLRGGATPRLRADRSAPVTSQHNSTATKALYDRWRKYWSTSVPNWFRICLRGRSWQKSETPCSPTSTRLLPCGMTVNAAAQLLYCERGISRGVDAIQYPSSNDPCFSSFFQRRFNRIPFPQNEAFNLAWSYGAMYSCNGHYLKAEVLSNPGLMRLLANASNKIDDQIVNWFVQNNIRKWPSSLATAAETHVISEGLWPSLDCSYAGFELSGLNARVDQLSLSGPMHTSLEPKCNEPDWLQQYDLCAPFTAIPLASLKHKFPPWNVERVWRSFLTFPLLVGFEPWANYFQVTPGRRPFATIMLFLPNPEHYEWLFDEHTPEEWSQGSASAIWDLTTGQILYADGVHTEASLRKHGKSFSEWLNSQKWHNLPSGDRSLRSLPGFD
jgi:hypothetical protein